MSIVGLQSATHDGILALLPKRRKQSKVVLIPSLAVFFVASLGYHAVYGEQFQTPKDANQSYAVHEAAPEEQYSEEQQSIFSQEQQASSDIAAPAAEEVSSASDASQSSADSAGSSSDTSASSEETSASSADASSDASSDASEESPEAAPPPPPEAIPEPPLLPPVVIPLPAAGNVYGVYLTPGSAADDGMLEGTLDSLVATTGNALVVDVKGGAVHFDADAPLAKSLGLVKKKYDLQELLQRAHGSGVYVIGRYVALKDAGLSSVLPKTLIAHPKSGRALTTEFVDPENPTVLEYNREVICALAKSGIDEINLDYIRFSTAEVGALRVFSGAEKAAKVGVFVQMARKAIDDCGSSTKLGISTFAILGWNYEQNLETLGQDVKAFAQYVDIISPMAYPSTFSQDAYYNPARNPGSRNYHLVWQTLEGYKDFLGDDWKKLRPWIQGYFMTKKGMEDQMKAVADAGLCGFTVWSANNVYDVTFPAIKTWKPAEGCSSR